jgi:hypothetical protein
MINYEFKQSKELYVQNSMIMGWAGDDQEQVYTFMTVTHRAPFAFPE